MGEALAANIQVFGGPDEQPEELARRVAAALREAVKAEGFEPVPAGEASDRELAIVIPPARGWVTVLDEAGDHSRETIETLARQLSSALGVLTLSVVGDGARSVMGLHGDGATLSMLPEDAAEDGIHDAWSGLLAGGNTAQDVAQIWNQAKDPVPRMAELLCVEAQMMGVSFAALGRLGRAGARLRFKSTGAMVTATGPRLRAAAVPGQKLKPAPGDPFVVNVIAQNRGAPSTGVEITLRSRLLTDEWCEVHALTVSGRDFSEEQKPRFRVVRNDRVIQARFDKAPLPGGGPTDVLKVAIQCQLTRAMHAAEGLTVSIEALGSASGGCSVELPIGPSPK